MEKTIKDYAPRIGYYPSYGQPKLLSKDEEFAYFEFLIPHAYRNNETADSSGVLPDGWMLNMHSFPVHTGIELMGEDKTFLYFKCKVPLVILNSPYGSKYHINISVVDTPDQEQKRMDIFEKAKSKEVKEYQQYEITFICERCNQQETEVHDDPIAGLVQRYCGNCHFTVLKLASYRGLWPEGKFE